MVKIIAKNKKAFHDYYVEEKIEAGISLLGTEVKSCREGKVNFKDSHCDFRKGELFLIGSHISPYTHAWKNNHESERERKLLLSKNELRRLIGKIKEKGYTLVPLSMYIKGNFIKVEIGLAKGKKLHDKREVARTKEIERQIHTDIKKGLFN